MFDRFSYAMVTVSDMDRSVRFYRDVLGLRLRFQSSDWTEFETGNTTIALHGGGKLNPNASSREHQLAGTVSLGLSVPNLDDAVTELKTKGVHFIMEPTVREEERIKLAGFTDPDGMPIWIAQQIGS